VQVDAWGRGDAIEQAVAVRRGVSEHREDAAAAAFGHRVGAGIMAPLPPSSRPLNALAPPPAAAPVRLNLGSGAHCPPGWVHVDNSLGALLGRHPRVVGALRRVLGSRASVLPAQAWSGNCRRMNLARGLALPDASADHAYSSHFLEHLTRDEARRLLADCRRVLRPGGTLRLLVPDLVSIVERYEASRRDDPAGAAKVFHDATGFFDYPFPAEPWRWPLWVIRRRHNHSFLWDEASLRADMTAAGFTGVRRRTFGQSDIPGILEVEVENRFEHSFCLEGTR
jgi:SAM-dependent methyltransferase